MIKALAHASFAVKNLDASLRFYCEQLGLKLAFEVCGDNGKRRGAYIHVGGRSFLEIGERELPGASSKGSFQHVCLEVDDIESTVGELRGKGLEVTDPHLGGDNAWQAWTADPDGNTIELHAYLPESRQTPALES